LVHFCFLVSSERGYEVEMQAPTAMASSSAIAFALLAWLNSHSDRCLNRTWRTNAGCTDDILAPLHLSDAGGHQLSSVLPLWKFPQMMEPEEVEAAVSQLYRTNTFDGRCNRTKTEHKALQGRSCGKLLVGEDPLLKSFLARLSRTFGANIPTSSHLTAVRYAPGAVGVPSHVDKFADKSRNDLTILVYLTNGSKPKSGLTVFDKADVSIFPESGSALAWMSSHVDSDHSLTSVDSDEPYDRLVLQIGLNLREKGNGFERVKFVYCSFSLSVKSTLILFAALTSWKIPP